MCASLRVETRAFPMSKGSPRSRPEGTIGIPPNCRSPRDTFERSKSTMEGEGVHPSFRLSPSWGVQEEEEELRQGGQTLVSLPPALKKIPTFPLPGKLVFSLALSDLAALYFGTANGEIFADKVRVNAVGYLPGKESDQKNRSRQRGTLLGD